MKFKLFKKRKIRKASEYMFNTCEYSETYYRNGKAKVQACNQWNIDSEVDPKKDCYQCQDHKTMDACLGDYPDEPCELCDKMSMEIEICPICEKWMCACCRIDKEKHKCIPGEK